MSGAGRSTAANVLEDLGWFVVDNLPPGLLPTLAELGGRTQGNVQRIAAVVDVRSGSFFADLTEALGELADRGNNPHIIFLEAADTTLVGRFEGVRRPHPLQGDGRLVDGIAREREMLRDLRANADIVIDTELVERARARREGAAGVRGGERRPARDGHLVRLQVRPPRRRRPRAGLPVPAQPALGARAAADDRPGGAGERLRPESGRARSSSSTSSWRCSTWSRPDTGARASATPRSPSAARAASTGRWPSPRRSPAGWAKQGLDISIVHRDLGRE